VKLAMDAAPVNSPNVVWVDGTRLNQVKDAPKVRLRHLFNVKIQPKGNAPIARFVDAEKGDVPIVAWAERIREIAIILDDNSVRNGFADAKIAQVKTDDYVSFDGLGICKVEKQDADRSRLIFTQP
jgi:hypothetical protein